MPADAGAQAGRFTARAYRPGDEEAILDLFARSFHARRSPAHFEWKYLRDPFGAAHISLTFDEERRLAGHYAGYTVPFFDEGRALLAHQIGDTMTETSVRHIGRGATSVLGRTALHFYDTFCEGKIAFNYGFNVANIQKFSLRFLRSDRVEPVGYRLLDLDRTPLRPMGRAERLARGWRVTLARETTPAWDELFTRVAHDYRFLVRRDAAYVRWRYFECPDVEYAVASIRKWGKLVGWSVFRVRDDVLTWGDALFDPHWPEAPGIVLRQVAAPLPVRRIEGWFPARPAWFDRELTALGFENVPEPQDLSLMCVPFVSVDAVARMRDALYYTKGDSDLF